MLARFPDKELKEKYDVDSSVVFKAFEKLEKDEVFAVAFSGKIASGKDTVALGFAESLLLNQNKDFLTHAFFAAHLKEEMTETINIIKDSTTVKQASETLAEVMAMPLSQALHVTELLFEEVKSGKVTTGYDKTHDSRLAIQFLGTDIRRAQNDLYWVKPFVKNVLNELASGNNVIITDTRFVNEAEAILDMKIPLIRLDVSPEEQSRRVKIRDGVVLSEEIRTHVSDTALDDFQRFTFRINTDALAGKDAVIEEVHRMVRAGAERALSGAF